MGRPLRVLYLMHVDVLWIKQRPHFLAEELLRADGVDVDLRYLRAWRRGLLPGRGDAPDLLSPVARVLPQLPPLVPALRWRLNPALARLWLTVTTRRQRPDVVWVTHPRLWPCVPRNLRERVVYDAMDVASAFPGMGSAALVAAEGELCRRARHVLCTSLTIGRHLASAYGRDDAVLVRNALDDRGRFLPDPHGQGGPPAEPEGPGAERLLLYFGTVSDWFDADLVVRGLERHPHLRVRLVGPVDRPLPEHPRLEVDGPVPHDALPGLAARADAFVMPFVVTELIEGVDPVKLYEYVALGRPTIACHYPEIDHFGQHVHFYRSDEEFLQLLDRLMDGELPAPGDVSEFVAANSWRARAAQVLAVLGRTAS